MTGLHVNGLVRRSTILWSVAYSLQRVVLCVIALTRHERGFDTNELSQIKLKDSTKERDLHLDT